MSNVATRWGPAIFLLAMILAACGGQAPPAAETASQPPAEDGKISEEERRRLLSLGYAGFSAESADGESSGAVRFDRQRSYPGYNLATSRSLRLTELFDPRGRVIQSWTRDDKPGVWLRSVLLPDGDLLVMGWLQRSGPGSRYVQRLTWDNELVWRKDILAHHDISPSPDGLWTILAMNPRSIPALHATRRIRDEEILLFDGDGEIRDRRSLYDMMRGQVRLNPAVPGKAPGPIDYFHANTVRWMSHPELEGVDPLYSTRNLVITIRNLNAVIIVDWDSGRTLWVWGPGVLGGPHDATPLANGNLLIFDNGIQHDPQWSRVIELNPLTQQIEWEYRAPNVTDFFTLSRGAGQRLANGNTLITESDTGRAFEVTVDGEVVWEYFNPHVNDEEKRATMTRVQRYELDYVEAIRAAVGG